ncbi:hypothetical protein MD484_g8896, partial [Candolleomyces efflorescens]
MTSIWDSPAWRSLGSFATTSGNLTFSFYIDWFNPLTNKIAGKTVSCGAIMFFCLNLPYELQHLPENTFFAGITPPPKEPNVVTISNLADPIMDRLDYLYRVGKALRTPCYPDGRLFRVGVLPAIGDLLAMRKALGFAGVGSKAHFCSFCKLHRDNIDELDVSKFAPRIGAEVMAASQSWQEATTKKERDSIFQKYGVRSSSIHLLSYRDPVKHTVLGLMHNWIEGILQHHARVFWGIGVATVKSAKKSQSPQASSTEASASSDTTSTFEYDMAMLDEEIQNLALESQQHNDSPQSTKRQAIVPHDGRSPVDALMDIDEEDGEDQEFVTIEDNGEDDDDNEADIAEASACPKVFSPIEMAAIHKCLSKMVVPSWVARPPTNLGEASHGKLKADEWLILFTVFLPAVIPEIWLANDGSKRKSDLLENFHDLLTCTNIICAHTASAEQADKYLDHYIRYRSSTKDIFQNSSSRPNHHYAMHNADLMKFWGPLMKVSEYRYESHNGSLQRIKTNNHLWELDYTMLRNICRRGRLQAMFEEGSKKGINRLFSSALDILHGYGRGVSAGISGDGKEGLYSEIEEASFNGEGDRLPDTIYDGILELINSGSTNPQSLFCHQRLVPHPLNANVLPRYAQTRSHIGLHGRSYSVYRSHEGNSSVSYRGHGGSTDAGFIQMIIQQVLNGRLRTFLAISPHSQLCLIEQAFNPYGSKPGFQATIVYDEPPSLEHCVIVEEAQIIGHVPFYRRPSGSFGIKRKTLILVNSLHRDR